MSNNSSLNIPQTPAWWKQNHYSQLMENPPQNPNPNAFNYNPNPSYFQIEQPGSLKQLMFEKPLTPSDVGKLNRLVIPKQYAEKYFPLGAAGAESSEKGMLLCLEDQETGKFWRFRYSYWSSSQSYVLTKGWSRFVKDKKLEAGDVVLFERHTVDSERKFIGWRRRLIVTPAQNTVVLQPENSYVSDRGRWGRVLYNAHPYPAHPHAAPVTYHTEYLPSVVAGSSVSGSQQNGISASNKRHFRLFGVNLPCEPQESDQSDQQAASDGSSFSSDGPSYYQYYSSTSLQNQMN